MNWLGKVQILSLWEELNFVQRNWMLSEWVGVKKLEIEDKNNNQKCCYRFVVVHEFGKPILLFACLS